ncbi:MAG: FAD-binding protein [Deltaproteobacteria bacterium]|nr:FAD-binding protein [Deltaproteobacteria bacterium]
MIQKTVEADVLCAGGGIAGLVAAIRAREPGAKVVPAGKVRILLSSKKLPQHLTQACFSMPRI